MERAGRCRLRESMRGSGGVDRSPRYPSARHCYCPPQRGHPHRGDPANRWRKRRQPGEICRRRLSTPFSPPDLIQYHREAARALHRSLKISFLRGTASGPYLIETGCQALLEFTSRLPNGSSTRTSLGFDLAVGDDMQPILMVQSPSAASKRAFSSILTLPLAFTISLPKGSRTRRSLGCAVPQSKTT